MKTIYADVRDEAQLLIQGAKGKVNDKGEVSDVDTVLKLKQLTDFFVKHINEKRE
jgi:hypothetical protein